MVLFGGDEGRPHHRSWPDEDQNKSHGGDDSHSSQDDHCHGPPCADVQQPQRAEKRVRTRARATDLSFIMAPPLSKWLFSGVTRHLMSDLPRCVPRGSTSLCL